MPFSKKAFKGLVTYTHREISSAKYKIGNTYHDAIINSIEEEDSKLVLRLLLNPINVTSEVTVSEVVLYDTAGEVFYNKAESIKFNPTNEGIIIRITINFMEVN